MTFSYYPGCTLRTKAVELDRSARAAAAALGVTLEEIPEWQCCGGVYPMAKDEISRASFARKQIRLRTNSTGSTINFKISFNKNFRNLIEAHPFLTSIILS